MQQIPLAVTPRETTGKGAARKLRAAGLAPAVIYGVGDKAQNLTVAVHDLEKIIAQTVGGTAFVSLSVEGEGNPRMAVLQEVQKDHLGRKLRHVDFLEIRPDQELTLEIPLEMTGVPKGAESGGMLSVSAYSLTIRGLVANIPDALSVDVSDLDVGDSLYAEDVELPESVSHASGDNFLLASCQMPAVVELPEDEVEGEEEEEGLEGEGAEEGAESEGKAASETESAE
jgi:large subunit ribosomal protein L25